MKYLAKTRNTIPIIIVWLIINTQSMWSQKDKQLQLDIEGYYNISETRSPEGGGHYLIIRENQTYYTIYFGGMSFGTWKMKDSVVYFKSRQEPKFIVYSRQQKNLKNKKYLSFGFSDKNEAYVQLGEDQSFRPIFNKRGNCFQPKYSITVPEGFTTLRLAKKEDKYRGSSDTYTRHQVSTYRIPKRHNDVMIITLPEHYTTVSEFKAIYKDNTLFFGPNDKGSPQRPLNETQKENTEYTLNYSGKSLLPDVLEYGNEFFPVYNDEDNVDPNELIPFKRINITDLKTTDIKCDTNPLFIANCD